MRDNHRTAVAALLSLLALTWILPGCGPTASPADSDPTDANAPSPSADANADANETVVAAEPNEPAEPNLPPLPEEALTDFDELKPDIGTLKNNKPDKLHEQARKAIAEADQALAKKNYLHAINRLERAKGFDRSHPEILTKLARAYMGMPNWGKALDNLEAAAEVEPNNIETQVTLGDVALRQDIADKALLAYRRALHCDRADPNNPLAARALLGTADLLAKEGRWQASLQAYRKLTQWLVNHGSALAESNELASLVRRPDVLMRRQADLLTKLRRWDQAADLLTRIHKRDRGDREVVADLIETLRKAKRFDQAEDMLADLLVERNVRDYVLPLAHKVAVDSGDKSMPLRLWNAATRKGSPSADTAVALASASEKLDNISSAMEILTEALEENVAHAQAGGMLVRLYLAKDRKAQAVDLLARQYASDAAGRSETERALRRVADTFDADSARAFIANQVGRGEDTPVALHYVAGRIAEYHDLDDQAVDQYNAALKRDDEYFPAYDALAQIYARRDDGDALEDLRKRLDKLSDGTDSAMALQVLGRLQLIDGQAARAAETFEKALQRQEGLVPALLQLAEARDRLGKTDLARQALLQAMMEDPDNPKVYSRLFESYLQARSLAEAREVARRAARRLGDKNVAQVMQAKLALAAGQRDAAMRLLAQLEKEDPDNLQAALLRTALQRREQAGLPSRDHFEKIDRKLLAIVRAHPDSREAHRQLAELYADVFRHEKAATHYRRLYQLSFRHPREATEYATALMRIDRHEKAAAVLTDLLQEMPDSYVARRMLLDALQAAGQPEQEVAVVREALTQQEDPNGLLARWYRYRLWDALGRARMYDKAQAEIDQTIAATRRDIEKTSPAQSESEEELLAELRGELNLHRSEKLRLYADANAYDELIAYGRTWDQTATGLLEQSEDEATQDWARSSRQYARRLTVLLLADEGRHDQAQKMLDTWIDDKTDPSVEWLRELKILLLGEAGDPNAAKAYAVEWIQDSPIALAPRQALVAVLVDAGRYDEALKLLGEWIDGIEIPSGPFARDRGEAETVRWCRMTSVSLLLEKKKYHQALKRIDEYLKEYPKEQQLYRFKAEAYAQQGKVKDQISAMEQAYRLAPDQVGMNNDFGYMLADAGMELDRARKLIGRAVSSSPSNTAFLDSLAWVLYKQGEFHRSAELLAGIVLGDEFAKESPLSRAVIYDHAGDAVYRLGWEKLAKQFWDKAIQAGLEMKDRTEEVRKVMIAAEAKSLAVQEGKTPKLAPLGQGVKVPSQDSPESGTMESRE